MSPPMRAVVVAFGIVLPVVWSAGCGRWHFDAQSGDLDAGTDPDTGDAAATCDLSAPFGTPVVISELADPGLAADGTLRLAPDELSGYFWSLRTGNQRIYYAKRTTRGQPFSFTIVSGLNTVNNDLDPTLSSDGTLLVFRHNIPGDDLWAATPTSATTFINPAPIANLNTGGVDAQPYLQEGGNELLFESKRSGVGDLYRSIRTGTTFSAPTLIAELSTMTADEGDPVLSADGLTLYFRSDRPASLTGYNIWVATRASTASVFGPATLVPNVSSAGDDGPSFLSTDGCRLYLSSDRGGDNDIYVATRGT